MDNNDFNNSFEPQLPFTDNNIHTSSEPNTKQYSNADYNHQTQKQSEPAYRQYQQQPNTAHHTDYSQASYYNASQSQRPNMNQQGFTPPPYAPPQYNQPPQNQQYYAAPPYQQYQNPVSPPNGGIPYAPYEPYYQTQPKNKMNGGLITVIVVLSVLLASSFLGIFIYAASQSKKQPTYEQYKPGFDFTIPSYTLPSEETEEEQGNYEDSDYSDKIIKNYAGLELKDKPKDYSDAKKYTSQYSYNQASESVVGILCYTGEITSYNECDSQGSGIIISADGYVITNAHVIGNSKTAYIIQVITADGTAYKAGVVGYDTRTDLAVLKMDKAKNLKPATFGDSDKTEIGEDIIVIGNPGGLTYNNSLTKGIVSAVNRDLSTTTLVKYIQIDAAINPGNSGGPVVNMHGQIIGVATSKIVSEQYEGMGFAIPSKTVKKIIDELVKTGYVTNRVKIGISGYAVSTAAAQAYNVPEGIYIDSIVEGGPCDDTDLRSNDIITKVDGKEVATFADVYEILEKHKAGDKIELEYYRYSTGKEDTVKITLQEDKAE